MANRGALAALLWWCGVVVAFYLSCPLAPCDAGQVHEHDLNTSAVSCTCAAHSFVVAFLQSKNQYIQRLYENSDVICLKETHGKIKLLQPSFVLHTQFRMVGTFVNDHVNAGGSAMFSRKTLLHDAT